MTFWELYTEPTRTSPGFFWKAGWAFVLGYAISGMIRGVCAVLHRMYCGGVNVLY
jgi:hypothetical protein